MYDPEDGTDHFIVEDLMHQLPQPLVLQLHAQALAEENAAWYTVIYWGILDNGGKECSIVYCNILGYRAENKI